MTCVSLLGDGGHALTSYLIRCGWQVRAELSADAQGVLVVGAQRLPAGLEEALLRLSVPLLLVGPTLSDALADVAGLVPGPITPVHEVRVRPGPDAGDVTARLGEDLLLSDRIPLQDKVADDVEVLLTASVAFVDHPIGTWRPATGVGALTLGSTPSTLDDPVWHRLVHRLARHALGHRDEGAVRVGLLGYGGIGVEHATALSLTDGLALTAVADPNAARLQAARSLAPDMREHSTGEALLADDEVDLVVVSTPPNSHTEWVTRALEAGKSVVVEKPFCLTVEEADRQIQAAAEQDLALVVYQNRRWDPDYLGVKRAVLNGQLGEVFHYESFIGGYAHPCNYWHSHDLVSGGAIYDWGSHYLDWALDLIQQEIEWVSAATHKRVWHDVTNADHSRVLLHFVDGVEAEFTHSDLAAATKPKFYVLGTTGALVGDWREERVIARSPVGTLVEDRLAASDSPAELRLFTPDGNGRTHETLLSLPPAPPQPFHRQLADLLLSGEPMEVTLEGCRRNVAVMQAATRSAARGGQPVPLPS